MTGFTSFYAIFHPIARVIFLKSKSDYAVSCVKIPQGSSQILK